MGDKNTKNIGDDNIDGIYGSEDGKKSKDSNESKSDNDLRSNEVTTTTATISEALEANKNVEVASSYFSWFLNKNAECIIDNEQKSMSSNFRWFRSNADLDIQNGSGNEDREEITGDKSTADINGGEYSQKSKDTNESQGDYELNSNDVTTTTTVKVLEGNQSSYFSWFRSESTKVAVISPIENDNTPANDDGDGEKCKDTNRNQAEDELRANDVTTTSEESQENESTKTTDPIVVSEAIDADSEEQPSGQSSCSSPLSGQLIERSVDTPVKEGGEPKSYLPWQRLNRSKEGTSAGPEDVVALEKVMLKEMADEKETSSYLPKFFQSKTKIEDVELQNLNR